jgi:hypothetical protein
MDLSQISTRDTPWKTRVLEHDGHLHPGMLYSGKSMSLIVNGLANNLQGGFLHIRNLNHILELLKTFRIGPARLSLR